MIKEKKIEINCIRYIHKHPMPSNKNIKNWINFSLVKDLVSHVNLIFVGEKRMKTLNFKYLKKDKSTNVLTFPYIEGNYIHGDIILCAQVINREAKEFGFSLNFRWAHMIVHSMLHLQGFSHDTKSKQNYMEKVETQILNKMNFGNPYVRA